MVKITVTLQNVSSNTIERIIKESKELRIDINPNDITINQADD